MVQLITNSNTIFKCNICKQIVVFNVENLDNYFNKDESDKFFASSLTTYRVYHDFKDNNGKVIEKHLNTVVVDQNNQYRSHKDWFKVSINNEDNKKISKSYIFINGIIDNSNFTSSIFRVFLIFNREECWALDCYHDTDPKNAIDIPNLITVLDNKINDIKREAIIYKSFPEHIIITLLNQDFHIYNDKNIFLCILLNKLELRSILEPFFIQLCKNYSSNSKIIPNRETISLIIKGIESNSNINVQYLVSIITDDIFDYTFESVSELQFAQASKLIDMIFTTQI